MLSTCRSSLSLLVLLVLLVCPAHVLCGSGLGTAFTWCVSDANSQATQLVSWNGNSGNLVATANATLPNKAPNFGVGSKGVSMAINPLTKLVYVSAQVTGAIGRDTSVLVYSYTGSSVTLLKQCSFTAKDNTVVYYTVSNVGPDAQSVYMHDDTSRVFNVLNITTCTIIPNPNATTFAVPTVRGGLPHRTVTIPQYSSIYYVGNDLTANTPSIVQVNYATNTLYTYPLPSQVNLGPSSDLFELGASVSENTLFLYVSTDVLSVTGTMYQIPIVNATMLGMTGVRPFAYSFGNPGSSGPQVLIDSTSALTNNPATFYAYSTFDPSSCGLASYQSGSLFNAVSNTTISSAVPPINNVRGTSVCGAGYTNYMVVDLYNTDTPGTPWACPGTTTTPTTKAPTGSTTAPPKNTAGANTPILSLIVLAISAICQFIA